MKALSAAAVSAAAGIIVPCVAVSSGSRDISSWWHAMDGIPILMDRRPERKMSVNAYYSSVANHHPEGSDEWSVGPAAHGRFLAFGDYVDPTFSCPATVTCPDVCVASVECCPEDAICPGTHPDNEGDPDHEYEVGYKICMIMCSFLYKDVFSCSHTITCCVPVAVCRRDMRRSHSRGSMRFRSGISVHMRGAPFCLRETSRPVHRLFDEIPRTIRCQ